MGIAVYYPLNNPPEIKMSRHKHADLMLSWAAGESIQFINCEDEWEDVEYPCWDENTEYRITPKFRNKHYELIKAYAEGKVIQKFSSLDNEWVDVREPMWFYHYEFRLKPEWYHYIPKQGVICWVSDCDPNLKNDIRLIQGSYYGSVTKTRLFYCSRRSSETWNYATPLTQEEFNNFNGDI
jgi:hypothetical protein